MMAVGANSLNNFYSQPAKAQLPEAAQRELDELRAAVDVRLAALEAVLADPSRGESLEGLILDLARVASEEAEAAASRACLVTKLQADTEISEARMSAETALEREREIIADLRRELEQAQQVVSYDEGQTPDEFKAVRQQLEAEISIERGAAADAERLLDRERQIAAELTEIAELATARSTALEREVAQLRAEHEETKTRLAREREAAVALEHAYTEVHSRVEAERASVAEAVAKQDVDRASSADLRRTAQEAQLLLEAERASNAELRRMADEAQLQLEVERASSTDLHRAAKETQDRLASLGRLASAGEAEHNEAADALASTQAEAAELQRVLTETKKALRVERELSTDLRAAAEQAEQRASSILSEQVQSVANVEQASRQLAAAQAEADALRAEVTAIRSRAASSPTPYGEAAEAQGMGHEPEARPQAKRDAPHHAPETTEWGVMRLAPRHSFRQKVDVQINGQAGVLCDLSITGCQLLSPGALKPNQVLKVVMAAEQTPFVCAGKVVWVRIEPPTAGGPLFYRAGVQFTKTDPAAIDAFVTSYNVPA
jgi:hypothetical protein